MTSQWDEDSRFPAADWRAEVANDDTRLGYRAWVADQYVAAGEWDFAVLDTTLVGAIDERLSAQLRVDALAIRALHAVMVEQGWSEVTVDVEEQSTVEAVSSDDGSLNRDELDDEDLREDLFSIAGNCPRSVYTYRDGEFRVTRTDLEQQIKSSATA